MELETMPVISTAHVSEETAEWLRQQGIISAEVLHFEDPRPKINISANPHGWFVRCVRDAECPADLQAVMIYMINQGYDYIMFDQDADTVDDLPVFDW